MHGDGDPDHPEPGRRLAFAWGLELRRARLRAGLTQVQVAAAAGTSASMICRIELGRGAGFPLDLWAEIAERLGVALDAEPAGPARAFGIDELRRIAELGAWRPVDAVVATTDGSARLILERDPQAREILGRASVSPGSMVVVLIADVVTDADRLVDDLKRSVALVRRLAPTGWSTGGLVVVRRTELNSRRLGSARPLIDTVLSGTGTMWIAALRSREAPVPDRPGLVWMAPSGRRLIPRWLYLRTPRAA